MSTRVRAPVQRFVPPARFRVPAPPSAFVPRPALVERLERSAAPLTIVVGSPGAGKTALVGSWVEQHAHPTVWLSCDPTDDDPVRFWSALAIAVQHVVPGAGADALRRLDDDGRESLDAAASLASDLGTAGDLVVVVDDFHLVGSAPGVVTAFVRALPVGARLVLLTRQDPSFPVGRLRAQGRLLEIRDRDMALDLEEAGRLLGLLGVEVDEEDLQRLLELTEGWAAGLHLAGLSLLARPDPEGLLKEFADTDRGVSDFLVNEVLDLQDPDVADFLVRTSVLESFDAGLCAAVTGRDDAGEVLRSLVEAHLFVVQLDRRAGAYRYHHLFGSFLRGRLAERTPHGLQDAHAAAARAYAERGDVLSAVDHAMAASDVDGAFRLLRGAVMDQLDVESRRAAVDTVRAWLRQYGAAHLESDPELVLECCLYLAALAVQGDLEVWLHRWEQRAASHPPDPRAAALHAAVWSLHLLHAGDPDAALARVEEARRLDREHPSTSFWVSQWPVVAVQAHLWRDELQEAADTVAEARRTPSAAPVQDVVRLPGMQSWTAAVSGELLEAEREADFALESADALGLAPSNLGRVFPLLALAVVAADRGDADGANRLADAATTCAVIAARPPMLLLSLLCQAGNAITQGRAEDASALLGRAHLVLPGATPVVHDHVHRMEARAAMGAGQASAGALVRGLLPTPVRDLLAARHLVVTGDRVAAARLLDDVGTRMTTRRLRVEHGLLRARACGAADRTRAVHEVTTAAELAAPVGLLRPFVEEAAHLRGALEVVTADPRLEPFVGQALDIAGRRPAAARAASGRPAVDGLSDRELDVLRYLASRLTYPEVARELFISVNTLKSHVKAVYRKLGAAGRDEAVAAARRAGLL